jgi:tRNA (adenine37-N6)-methyltransferase
MNHQFPVIGLVHSCFKEKFGIPRQPGLAPLATAEIEMLPPFDDPDAFIGLEGCSHIWLQFVFHANSRSEWKPKVKPPRLGGNKSLGVFATRAPTRPAPIGLSVVGFAGLERRQGKLLVKVTGVDLLQGTPVLDIKPYVPYVDSLPHARNEFAPAPPPLIGVEFSPECTEFCQAYQHQQGLALAELIVQLLQQDPRPQYQQPDPARIYGMKLLALDLRFSYQSLGDNRWQILVCAIIPL